MENYMVVADTFYGGTEDIQSFKIKEDAESFKDKKNSTEDMYTFFSIEVRA
jgi:hypothetical protein